jgi:rare lipoprotein A
MGATGRVLPLSAVLLGVAALVAGCSSPGPSTGSRSPAAEVREVGAVKVPYKVGRPYAINGLWYHPEEDEGYDRIGVASWYGPGFDGKLTANGETYDMNDLTAAHTTLPMPSVVQVTNLDNGRSMKLRVNDRGPFVDDRIIDVSRRAAQLLGFIDAGTARVRVTYVPEDSAAVLSGGPWPPDGADGFAGPVTPPGEGPVIVSGEGRDVGPGDVPGDFPGDAGGGLVVAETPLAAEAVMAANTPASSPGPPRRLAAPGAPDVTRAPVVTSEPAVTTSPVEPASPVVRTPPLVPAPPAVVARNDAGGPDPGGVPNDAPADGGTYVQAGAFADAANAVRARRRLSHVGAVQVRNFQHEGRELYRVRLGPYRDGDAALAALAAAAREGYPGSLLVFE